MKHLKDAPEPVTRDLIIHGPTDDGKWWFEIQECNQLIHRSTKYSDPETCARYGMDFLQVYHEDRPLLYDGTYPIELRD